MIRGTREWTDLFGVWCILQRIGAGRRLVSGYVASAEIPDEVVVGCLRLTARQSAHRILELFLNGKSRIRRVDRGNISRLYRLDTDAYDVETDTSTAGRDFRFFVQSDRVGRVQCNGVPNQLQVASLYATPF